MDKQQEEIKIKIHKINSIHYGGKIIAGGFLLITIALVIRLIFQEKFIWLILLGIGVMVLLGIIIWMSIEGAQDRYWNHYFKQNDIARCD